ncbi:MAG: 16S rRNA methyltransferase [Patescibacteria group bacterium]|nr:16S rRNA methyltransferase [Patescibacteria group bacterium]
MCQNIAVSEGEYDNVGGMDIDMLAMRVLKSSKYRHVTPELVARLCRVEVEKYKDGKDHDKDVLKAVKNKLHQVVGAFIEGRPDYKKALRIIRAEAKDMDDARVRTALATAMRLHASTRERFPFLDTFYKEVFRDVVQPTRILDLACGLNPLARPWMHISDEAEYLACDALSDMTEFNGAVFEALGWKGHSFTLDLLSDKPLPTADVVLLLKTLPCLEQVESGVSARILARINAPRVVVSFPGKSLSGREKGMKENYTTRFLEVLKGTGWMQENLVIGEELVFLLSR